MCTYTHGGHRMTLLSTVIAEEGSWFNQQLYYCPVTGQ
ncbi:hypothetical protein GBAR_LOCUS29779 [Geodia barretti]|uniref:Uncharacterized protein n=1 Tax=Geodia barretti TaxID=519541 RepID=A0AA35TVA5_GEOBA|nr:hypothetical protein GBAR_LOCUS29779 [Geodia barretti]